MKAHSRTPKTSTSEKPLRWAPDLKSDECSSALEEDLCTFWPKRRNVSRNTTTMTFPGQRDMDGLYDIKELVRNSWFRCEDRWGSRFRWELAEYGCLWLMVGGVVDVESE